MEKRDTLLSMHKAGTPSSGTIVELMSHFQLRRSIDELIHLTMDNSLSTTDLSHRVHEYSRLYGSRFSASLVRSLQSHDAATRQSIIWLLTILGDEATVPLLKQLASNQKQSRLIRLSASLALAGMGATPEVAAAPSPNKYARLYAIG